MSAILITGSDGMLGKSLSNSLKQNGKQLIEIDKTASGSKSRTEGSICFTGDVLDSDFLSHVSTKISQDGIKISGIVNCFFHPELTNYEDESLSKDRLTNLDSAFRSYPWEHFSQELTGNVAAVHNVMRFFLPRNLRENCSIINVASVLGINQPNQNYLEFSDRFRYKPPGYSVSKAAIIAYTEYLANLYAGSGFRFNSVAPGFLDGGQENSFKQRFFQRLSIQRFAYTSEIVAPIEFLLSESSSYISGSTLVVDGGYSKS